MAGLLRGDLPPEIPDDVDDPAVQKARGLVTLPRRVNWSRTDPTYDLSDRRDRAVSMSRCCGKAQRRTFRHFIDVDELVDL
jgi:hypothetical protein